MTNASASQKTCTGLCCCVGYVGLCTGTGLCCVVITHLLTVGLRISWSYFRCTVSHRCRILELLLSAYSATLPHRALEAQDVFPLICSVVLPKKHNHVLFDTSLLSLSAIVFSSSNLTKLA